MIDLTNTRVLDGGVQSVARAARVGTDPQPSTRRSVGASPPGPFLSNTVSFYWRYQGAPQFVHCSGQWCQQCQSATA